MRSNNPATWVTLAQAQAMDVAMARAAAEHGEGDKGHGVGILLGPLGNGYSLVGLDLDTCLGQSADGIERWAVEALQACPTYAEVSPSGTGIKTLMLLRDEDGAAVRSTLGIGPSQHGRKLGSARAAGGMHPPAIDVYLGVRYFAITGESVGDSDDFAMLTPDMAGRLMAIARAAFPGSSAATVPGIPGSSAATVPGIPSPGSNFPAIRDRVAELAAAQPVFAGLLEGSPGPGQHDLSRSGFADAIMRWLAWAGWSAEDASEAMSDMDGARGDDGSSVAAWMAEKGTALGGREFERAWERWSGGGGARHAGGAPVGAGLGAVPVGSTGPGAGPGSVLAPGERIADPTEKPPAASSGFDASDWRGMLQETRTREWRANAHNARLVLEHDPGWEGVFALNRFADLIEVRKRPPYETAAEWKEPRSFTDADTVRAMLWMQAQGLQVGSLAVFDAIVGVAVDRGFDPVRDYLEGLQWDQTRRLDDWMVEYLGVTPTAFSRAVGAKPLVASVARAFEPGCQVDTITVLEGDQGLYKSSALRALYGSDLFTDHISDLTSKDAALQIAGVWCLEFAEMEKLQKAEVARVKAFATTRIDRYRKPYGRTVSTVPRRCVFWATTNLVQGDYLQDETGNRRFWPLVCGGSRIDVDRVRRMRDQLWAEAVVRYRAREPWWITSERGKAHQEEAVAARMNDDAWGDKVRPYLRNVIMLADGSHPGVGIGEVLEIAVGKKAEHWTQNDKNRVARILTAEGWVRKRAPTDQQDRKLPRAWRYYPKASKPGIDTVNVVPLRRPAALPQADQGRQT